MTRMFFLFTFCLFLITTVNSQEAELDNQEIQQLIAINDTNSVNLLIDLSRKYARSSPDDAVNYGLQANILSEELNFKRGEALSLKYIGMAYYFQAMYLETIQYWQKSLNVFEVIGDTKGVANMLSNIGAIYQSQGDDTKAIEIYLRTLAVAEEIGDTLRVATVLNNIGGVYFNKEATRDNSLNYYLSAFEYSKQIDNKDAIGTSAVNAGVFYFVKQNADSALFYLKKSLEALKQTETGNVSYTLKFVGETYALKSDFVLANRYLNEALSLAKKSNSGMDIAMALIALGNTNKKQENYKTAIKYYQEAEVLAEEFGLNYQLEETFKAMAISFATMSDYEQAYRYEKLFSEVKDTLYNAENDKKIQRLQFNYDLDKKQGEVDILIKDKELQASEVRRQKAVKNAVLIGLVLIFIIAFILYRSYRSKVKINRILDKQKDEIEKLVLNILPVEVAKELQSVGVATPQYYKEVSVLFTDFKGFSKIAEGLSPTQLVSELNEFFIAFDHITDKYNLEKIKTIGDAYMCAGGIPLENDTHPLDAVMAGLEMQKFMDTNNVKRIKNGKIPWELRVGIHTGPVVAGVVGEKKFAYDIWGSTVNISSRMESNGEAGKLNISAITYELIKDKYVCSHRGKIYAKNIGDIDMYFVEDEVPLKSSNENSILQKVQP